MSDLDDFIDDDDDEEYSAQKRNAKKPSKHDKPSKKAKTKAKPISQYFEDSADEGGDGEEEEEEQSYYGNGNDYGGEDEKEFRRMEDEAFNRVDNRRMAQLTEDNWIQIAKRYDDQGEKYYSNEPQISVSNEAPVVGVEDCKCFAIKVVENKEYDVVLRIMNKFQDYCESGEQKWPLVSVYASSTKGYIYAECYSRSQIEGILSGMRDIYSSKIQLIDINNIEETYSIPNPTQAIPLNSFVNLKTGIYKSDWGVIEFISNDKLIVKVIPRLDYLFIKENIKSNSRPKQQLFPSNNFSDEIEMKVHPQLKTRCTFFRNKWFTNEGYLLMDIPMNAIDRTAKVTSEIIAHFYMENENELDDSHDVESKLFYVKDKVKIIRGELRGIQGTVERIDFIQDIVEIKPFDTSMNILTSPLKDLSKLFIVGDHIKIVAGAHMNESGYIVDVQIGQKNEKDDTLVIFTDISQKELKIRSCFCQISTEISTKDPIRFCYKVGDLVILNNNQVGIIQNIKGTDFTVLTEDNSVSSYKIESIRGRRSTNKFDIVLDKERNSVTIDNTVKIVKPTCLTEGKVVYICKGILFIKRFDTGQFVALRSRDVICVNRSDQIFGTLLDARPNGIRNGSKNREMDKVGTNILVIKGQDKGKYGIIKSVSATEFRVNIVGINVTKLIPRDYCKLTRDDDTVQDYAVPSTPGLNTGTPIRFAANTPAQGSMTPGNDTWAAQTPRTYVDEF